MEKFLIVVAAGSGTRAGSPLPKQFVEISGKAILQHTMEAFLAADRSLNILTVLSDDYINYWKKYCLSHHFRARHTLVLGGLSRFHSVKNALELVPDGALVAIHDGARPFISKDFAIRMLSCLDTPSEEDSPIVGMIPAVQCVDTLVRLQPTAEEQLFTSSGDNLDRSEIFAVQTPQVFLSTPLKAAYDSVPYSRMITDDAFVMRSYLAEHPSEGRLLYCPGERYNIKITTPEDLNFATRLL